MRNLVIFLGKRGEFFAYYLALSWSIPDGLITTLLAQAITAQTSGLAIPASLAASWLISRGLKRYTSASS